MLKNLNIFRGAPPVKSNYITFVLILGYKIKPNSTCVLRVLCVCSVQNILSLGGLAADIIQQCDDAMRCPFVSLLNGTCSSKDRNTRSTFRRASTLQTQLHISKYPSICPISILPLLLRIMGHLSISHYAFHERAVGGCWQVIILSETHKHVPTNMHRGRHSAGKPEHANFKQKSPRWPTVLKPRPSCCETKISIKKYVHVLCYRCTRAPFTPNFPPVADFNTVNICFPCTYTDILELSVFETLLSSSYFR